MLENLSRSTDLVESIPVAAQVFVPSGMAIANRCLSVTGLLLLCKVHTSLFSGCFPGCVISLSSSSVTGSMFLAGCVLGAVRSLNTYCHFMLLSTDIAGYNHASCTTYSSRC